MNLGELSLMDRIMFLGILGGKIVLIMGKPRNMWLSQIMLRIFMIMLISLKNTISLSGGNENYTARLSLPI
jgi:hypothetical protein